MGSDGRLDYQIIPLLQKNGNKTFIDIACGFGKWGYYIKKFLLSSNSVGLDIWSPYLKITRKKRIYTDLIIADAINLPLRKKAIDVCIACAVIEHFTKNNGKKLLHQLEYICRQKLILSTPNFKYKQGILRNNPYEIHKSHWKDYEFRKLGYEVKGIGIQFFGKIFSRSIPLIGKYLKNLILCNKLTLFSEVIIIIKNL